MQDLVAILIAVAAATWLIRMVLRRVTGGGCGTCHGSGAGDAEGFVALDSVRHRAHQFGRGNEGAARRPPQIVSPGRSGRV